jgi:hypothetical protein
MSHVRSRLGLLVAVASLVAACSSQKEICTCPSGGALITLRADLQSMITNVVADGCFQTSADTNQGISLTAKAPGTCHVFIQLADGETLSSDVTFASLGGCCAYTFVEVDGSAPVPFDGALPDGESDGGADGQADGPSDAEGG